MRIRANGHSALRIAAVVAAGLWVGFSNPAEACEGSNCASVVVADAAAAEPDAKAGPPVRLNKYSKQRVRTAKRATSGRSLKSAKVASRKSLRTAQLRTAQKTSRKPSVAKADASSGDDDESFMSASVADARAEMTRSDPPITPKPAPSDNRAAESPAAAPDAGTQVVAADQLNEVDRAASEAPAVKEAPATKLVVAAPPAPAATVGQAVASTDESTWDRTSLIGKIFIAFGGLLTLASAARMFIA